MSSIEEDKAFGRTSGFY